MRMHVLVFKVFTAVFEFGYVVRHSLVPMLSSPVGPWSEDRSLVVSVLLYLIFFLLPRFNTWGGGGGVGDIPHCVLLWFTDAWFDRRGINCFLLTTEPSGTGISQIEILLLDTILYQESSGSLIRR